MSPVERNAAKAGHSTCQVIKLQENESDCGSLQSLPGNKRPNFQGPIPTFNHQATWSDTALLQAGSLAPEGADGQRLFAEHTLHS